ncbi:hypothetical protein PVL96_00260 [Aeromonas hydrophila]|uniref:hypothetical protein n=1 Tax=Aeromonas hydrophila TaxID=644 RepID=UPI0023789F91|nr:hypothetical protein [Aeromonas hydrophila]MDD9223466.1 hypothetical protein [Aeromonas hydrophila]
MNVFGSIIKFFVAVFKSPKVKEVSEVAVDVIEDAAVDYLKDKAVKELKRHDIDVGGEDASNSKK